MLLYFCVEVLKESDPTSFLQVSWGWLVGGGGRVLLYFCVEVLKESDPTSFLQVSWGWLVGVGVDRRQQGCCISVLRC